MTLRIRLLRLGFPVLALLVTMSASAQGVGSLRGVVTDGDFDVPLGAARVQIVDLDPPLEVTGSDQGGYVFGEVPPGTYTVVFSKPGYSRQVRTGVVVSEGRLTDLDVTLVGEFTDMEEFVVQDLTFDAGTESALLEIRFEADEILDVVSSELISQAGASDAAAALTLVSGATVSDGKFAVIRGLPDRYVNSQLNGVRLPSADADTRAVELDLFPSAVIESVQVSKTFTPDQQGDASGGAVNVVLNGIPNETIFEIGFKTGFNSQVVGRDDFLTYRGGGVNFLGIDDGGRDIPDDGNSDGNPDFDGALGVARGRAPIDYGFDLTVGGKHELDNGVTIGGFVSMFYERDSSFHDNGRNDSLWLNGDIGDPLTPKFSGDAQEPVDTALLDITEASEEVKWGGLAAFGVETENHKINTVFFHSRSTEDKATLAEDTRSKQFFFPGHDPADPSTPGHGDDILAAPFLRFETLTYTERITQSLQFNGEHTLNLPEIEIGEVLYLLPPVLDWAYSINSAETNEPDKRQFGSQFIPVEDTPGIQLGFSPAAQFLLGNLQRTFEEIVEESDQYAVNLRFPFEQWDGEEGFLKFGVFNDRVDRTFSQESFSNFNSPGSQPPLLVGGFDEFLSEHVANGTADSNGPPTIAGPPFTDVDYAGDQEIFAWYGMADLPVTEYFKLIGGVRFESTNINIANFPEADARVILPGIGARRFFQAGERVIDPVTGLPLGDARFEQDDVLPAIGFMFTPTDRLTFRASYSQTVARQTFKELSPVVQQEFLGGDIFVGNPALQMAALKNYDLRLDYRPYEGGLISVSWFKKDIEDPIEYVQRFDTAVGRFTTPVNFSSGELSGVEFEIRQDMGHFFRELEGLTLGANATFIDSEVNLPADEIAILRNALNGQGTVTSREMLNAPEYIINLFLTYNYEPTRTQIGLFYTIRGDTLVVGQGQVGGNFVPAIFQSEFDSLNLTVTQKIGDNWKLKFSAKNLTNPELTEVYRSDFIAGDQIKSSYTKGIDFSISLSAEFFF